MPKIMLVEDDNNLREIYEARLLAEGYEIVSAKDGEEALALAVKEKPDLIISDVMMPKISGFDMLDILRSTPETKDAKVIMMTALSQAEDKSRADKLGADRYLVKSQVTLEDVAKVAREVLSGESPTSSPAPPPADPPATEPPTATPPAADGPVPTTPVAPAPDPTPPPEPPTAPPPPVAEPPAPPTPEPPVKPAATTSVAPAPVLPPAQTTASEEAAVHKQINQFISTVSPQAPPAATPEPTPPVPAPAPTPAPQPPSTPPVAPEPPPPAPIAPPPPPLAPEPEQPTPDPTAQAADQAATLAHTVNDIFAKQDEQKARVRQAAPAVETTPSSGTSIAGKKVIKPLNDITTQGPDLNKLLEKEQAATAAATPAATSVVAPSGQTSAPAPAPDKAVDTHPPGNVITPGGVDPNSIAL
jgi:CheY-like chemotaxis protein